MSRKERNRDRRRVERTLGEAFAALEQGETALAARLARRAREAGPMNPRVLHDAGRVLLACGQHGDAEDALRAAIAQAPDYAEAFAALAELQAGLGKWAAALRLQARAVELSPGDELAQAALARMREQAEAAGVADGAGPDDAPPAAPVEQSGGAGAERVPLPLPRADAVDALAAQVRARWRDAGGDLVRGGLCVLPRLWSAAECAAVAARWRDGAGLDREYLLAGTEGAVRYRWLREPLPEGVQVLWHAVWRLASELAPVLAARLREDLRWPGDLSAWLREARRRGRLVPLPRLLWLAPGAASPPERGEDRRAFPLRAALDLGGVAEADSAARAGARDATVTLTDQRPGRKVREHRGATAPGDAVLFCVRDRLDRVGDVFGLQPVTWRLGPFAGGRLLLELALDGAG